MKLRTVAVYPAAGTADGAAEVAAVKVNATATVEAAKLAFAQKKIPPTTTQKVLLPGSVGSQAGVFQVKLAKWSF